MPEGVGDKVLQVQAPAILNSPRMFAFVEQGARLLDRIAELCERLCSTWDLQPRGAPLIYKA